MKKIILGLALLTSFSAFAAFDEDVICEVVTSVSKSRNEFHVRVRLYAHGLDEYFVHPDLQNFLIASHVNAKTVCISQPEYIFDSENNKNKTYMKAELKKITL